VDQFGAIDAASVADLFSTDADLAMIVNRWPTLPADAKAGILAIVKAAGLPT
jgi:hypothetical protein